MTNRWNWNTGRAHQGRRFCFAFSLACFASIAAGQNLALPPRPANAPDGDEFVRQITTLDLAERDKTIADEFLAGNVPNFLRTFCPITVTNVAGNVASVGTFFAAPDYLAIGSDTNYFLAPISPGTAQRIADAVHCLLPTRKMVDDVYAAAQVKLRPSPIPPSTNMTTVAVFAQHNDAIRAQRTALTNAFPLGALVAGHKKDVVISARLIGATNKVAIYGWHKTNGVPIQPLYLGHVWWWVDYSQCIRLVSQSMIVNGETMPVARVLADQTLCGLVSDEGAITNPHYSTNFVRATASARIDLPWPEKFESSPDLSEQTREIYLPDEVRIFIDAPDRESFHADRAVLLIFYAVPNGNTIGQTIGKKLQPGDDWHFDIQHIGAQTRWLRRVLTNETVVVAYLAASGKSWPNWRKQHNDRRIVEVIDGVRGIFSAYTTRVALASHSGGGSLVIGYINAVNQIPDCVTRIAFLDSDYAYASDLHADKLQNWLAASDKNHLCVVAYQDYLALLNGKPFVSENGGTWGRSHSMLDDLRRQFEFTSQTNGGLETYSSLNGRIEFLLKENPDKKILHTVQVERNGFIQAMLSGTPNENKGYQYLGERAYSDWIK